MTKYRLILKHSTFSELAKSLGEERKSALFIPILPLKKIQHASALKGAISKAVWLAPWRLNCLAQALCAAQILRDYQVPYAMFFGVRRPSSTPETLEAHAWVMAGHCNVCGGISFNQYAPLNCFTHHA